LAGNRSYHGGNVINEGAGRMDNTTAFMDISPAISYVMGNLPSEVPVSFRRDLAHNFVLLFDDGLVDVWPAPPRPASTEPPRIDIGAPFDYAKDTYTIRQGDLAELGKILIATLSIVRLTRSAGWNR
jgi:hypothetical protein